MKSNPRYQPGDKIGGRYQVHQVKMGGMGEVYLCLDLQENYPYALKTFQQRYQSAALRQAFEKEVATWVALEKHPNIVRCFYMDILDNHPFMVLQWIAGEDGKGSDLRSWLRHGPLDLRTALDITIDIVRGLIHAQEKQPGLVHRDLKPENILMVQGPLAKITDFGLAQIVAQAGLELNEGESEAKVERQQSLVCKGGIAGTPPYMAPEQWRGESLDERTDIYAVGCILYEMLTGKWPFHIDFIPTTPQQFQQWVSAKQVEDERERPVVLPAGLPIDLCELINFCLVKQVKNRLNNLTDMMARLELLYNQQFGELLPQYVVKNEFTFEDYHNRGVTYYHLRHYKKALADYTRAIEMAPNSAISYTNRGNVYEKLQKYQLAFSDHTRAIEIIPNLFEAFFNRGATFVSMGNYERAIQDFDQAVSINPINADSYIKRGDAHSQLKMYETALQDYEIAIKLDPNSAEIYCSRGAMYIACGQYELAFADFKKAIEFDPNFPVAYVNRGTAHKDLKNYEMALSDFSRAISLDPYNTVAYYNRGNTYRDLHKYELALTDFNLAIEMNPYYAVAFHNRGIIYADLEHYEEALADYNRAIELNLQDVRVYYNRAKTFHHLGNYEAAVIDYEQVIILDPEDAEAYSNRGVTRAALQQYGSALADFQYAIELNPNLPHAYLNAGTTYIKLDKFGEALPFFEKAAKLGLPQAKQYVEMIKLVSRVETTTETDPGKLAFEAFQEANSLSEMGYAVSQFPFMIRSDFIIAVERHVAQPGLLQYRPYFEQRLGWLRQIAQEQNQ